jgi:hypothetical protein
MTDLILLLVYLMMAVGGYYLGEYLLRKFPKFYSPITYHNDDDPHPGQSF